MSGGGIGGIMPGVCYRALIVDNEVVIRDLLTQILEDEGFEVESTPSAAKLFAYLGLGSAAERVAAADDRLGAEELSDIARKF